MIVGGYALRFGLCQAPRSAEVDAEDFAAMPPGFVPYSFSWKQNDRLTVAVLP